MCMRTTDYSKKVKIILVDDNFDHLLGIRELINLETNFEVMATATNANIAINLVKKYQPDLVLMDINMPEKDGLTAMSEIAESQTIWNKSEIARKATAAIAAI